MSLEFRGFEVKELDQSGAGTFSGYASTWDRDMYDDVIVKGAFAQTLARDFKAGGAGIPLHWQHKDGSPYDVIGETLSAVEDEHGLLVTGRLDLDIPEGKRAYDLLRRGLIHQMSIGFIAEKTAWVEDEESKSPWDGYREIRQLKLFEISLVQVAANQGCEVLEVKSGRKISASNLDKIRSVIDILTELADQAMPPKDEPDAGPDDGDDGAGGDGSDQSDTDDPDDDLDDPDGKGLDPQWVRNFKEISDYFSLAGK